MSPLMGQHSQNSGGSQGLAAALATLSQRAAAGDQAAAATMRAIASGQTTPAGAVPGWNESINWGEADTGRGNTGGRAADRALAQAFIQGDQAQISQIEANKGAVHKDWTGGTLADLAPAVASGLGMLIGLPPAVTGAAVGGLMAAGGATNRSAGAGALLGGASGAAVGAVPGVIQAAGGLVPAATSLAQGRIPGAGGTPATPGTAPTVGGLVNSAMGGQPGQGVGGLIDTATGLLATRQGASDTAAAGRDRNEAVGVARGAYDSMAPVRQAAVGALLAPEPARRDLTARYTNAENPFAAGRLTATGPAAGGAPAVGAMQPSPNLAPADELAARTNQAVSRATVDQSPEAAAKRLAKLNTSSLVRV